MKWEIEPKPFAFVNIPREEPKRDKFIGHETFKDLSGRLELNISVLSDYLFIGSGGYDYQGQTVYYSFFRTRNQIAIPGSSIKGSVRSVLETISNSCVSQLASRIRTGPNREKPDERRYFPKGHSHSLCNELENLCPACRLFGMIEYGGRAGFSDALSDKNVSSEIVKIGELFGPTIVDSKKRKFYSNKKFASWGDDKPERNTRFVETVKKGSSFKTNLSFENLSQSELSLLFYSMGLFQDYFIKIGGAKPRCFGAVRFEPIKVKLQTDPLGEFNLKEGENLKAWIKKVMRDTRLLFKGGDLLEELKEEVSPKTDETCPRRNY